MLKAIQTAAENNYDIAVIGAGSAGFSASITAAELGAKVLLVGNGTIGGTCVNIGCVPSKTLIRAAETLHQARSAGRFKGISAHAQVSNWSAIMAEKNQLVSDLRKAKYTDVLPGYDKISYVNGRAQLCKGGVLVDGIKIQADKIIIATGSSPSVPPIDGITDVPYLSSTDALDLDHLPKSMMIFGGGVIACEIGQMYARMGTSITIFCRSRLLPDEEPEISAALKAALLAEGIEIQDGIKYISVYQDDGIKLDFDRNGQRQQKCADQLMIATGRQPNTKELGLSAMGVNTDANAGIKVNEHMQTSQAGVYAVGDVTGQDMFVYMAAYGARIAAEHALGKAPFAYDNAAMPAVTFTDPQVARVGLTEAAARSLGYDVVTSVLGMENVPRALAARDTRGLIKLIADHDTHMLLGAHIIAAEGADSIQTAAIAIKMGMTYEQLGSMVFPYLTTVEGLKLAAQTFDKDVSKLSCCAG